MILARQGAWIHAHKAPGTLLYCLRYGLCSVGRDRRGLIAPGCTGSFRSEYRFELDASPSSAALAAKGSNGRPLECH